MNQNKVAVPDFLDPQGAIRIRLVEKNTKRILYDSGDKNFVVGSGRELLAKVVAGDLASSRLIGRTGEVDLGESEYVFSDLTANFISAGVLPGDRIHIVSSSNSGVYPIIHVDGENKKLYTTTKFSTTASGLHYFISTPLNIDAIAIGWGEESISPSLSDTGLLHESDIKRVASVTPVDAAIRRFRVTFLETEANDRQPSAFGLITAGRILNKVRTSTGQKTELNDGKFTDLAVNFNADNVKVTAGDILHIVTGDDAGEYEILAVNSNTELEVDAAWTSTEENLVYFITTTDSGLLYAKYTQPVVPKTSSSYLIIDWVARMI